MTVVKVLMLKVLLVYIDVDNKDIASLKKSFDLHKRLFVTVL